MKNCKRCSTPVKKPSIKKENLEKNPDKYELCVYCRKFRLCRNCGIEFHHKQNQTCSSKCAKELKEKSFLMSCGTSHNFCRNSSSRKEWEKKMLQEENIVNVFQRESVKLKSKVTLVERYGVEHISKLESVKESKNIKLKESLKRNPSMYKVKWWEAHTTFINTLGYDPRLHLFGRASKESLVVFIPILQFCKELVIPEENIYIGFETKNEFFLKDKDKIYFYDFTILYLKLIIEFHGVAFHSRESDENWRNPFTNETSDENIKARKVKNQVAIESGFEILEIWSDVKSLENIDECKNFIIKKYESKKNH